MKTYYAMLLCLIMLCSTSYATELLSPEDEAFIKKYSAPAYIVEALDRHVDKFLSITEECEIRQCRIHNGHERHLVWQYSELPNYLVKYGLGRIYGRKKMQQCIEENNLDRLYVPKKYIYHIKGRARALTSSNYLVVAEKVGSAKSKRLDAEQVCQICTLLRETGYNDFKVKNVRWLSGGKIAFIDTEIEAFNEAHRYLGLKKIVTNYRRTKLHEYPKEGIKYVLSQLLACAPQDKVLYRKMYYEVRKALKSIGQKHRSFNYQTYFEELFPQPD